MNTNEFALSSVALAAVLAVGAAQGAVSVTGDINVWPGNLPVGPGDTDVGNRGLFVGGAPATGSLQVDGGSFLRAGALFAGHGGNGEGVVVFTGAGTRVELVGDGISDGVVNRLGVGEWGRGSLVVSDGAVLDGRASASACVGLFHYCNNFVGSMAGSDGSFTVTGAGSQARFLRGFYVGGVAVFHPPIDSFTAGVPGGTTNGRVNVLAGGTLATDNAILGLAPGGSSPTGTERSFASAVIDGASSVWRVTGPTIASDSGTPHFDTAPHRNAWATVAITNGGTLAIEGDGNTYASIGLTTGGGRTDMLVSGAGSNITFVGQSSVLHVGRSLGSATLDVQAGALVENVWYTGVGRDGSFGTLNIDGSGTLYRANGTATAAAAGSDGVAVFDIGRGGGTGVVNVTNGARLEMTATAATAGAPHFSLGRDAASSGTLNISGGGVVQIAAASVAPDTAGEAWNPFVRIGRDGSGTLAISGGGKLLVEGNAVSTPTHTRRTSLFIGGSGDATIGGRGVATISGTDSELRVSGSDAYIGVGHGPQATGQLTVRDQALIGTTILGVGNYGGTGVLRLDNAQVNLDGQFTGVGGYGASLVIGAGNGAVGNVSASNGAVIRISNTTVSGNSGGGMTIGGSAALTGGDGVLTLNNASVVFDMPANNAAISVGRSGSGLLRMSNGASIDIGGNYLFVGRNSGSDGTLIATGGSTITAGWVGVGRNLSAGSDVDGGTGTMVLNGATLFAQDVVIGTNGYLGGSAGAINVSGSVVNYGIFSPGNSPGLFTIEGNYVAAAGSRLILEVASNGAGGFVTDQVHFGGDVDFSGMTVEFRFLGDADPNAFQASSAFVIDSFLQQAGGAGDWVPLPVSAFSDTVFSASADNYVFDSFSFSAIDGARFVVTPVPEPGSWLTMGAGLLVLGAWRRRRSTAS